jgi:hypothetical protein
VVNGTLTAWQQFTVKDPITIAAGTTIEISSAYAGAVTCRHRRRDDRQ